MRSCDRLLILCFASFGSLSIHAARTHSAAPRFPIRTYSEQGPSEHISVEQYDILCEKNFLNALEGAADRVEDTSLETLSLTPTGIIYRQFCEQPASLIGPGLKRVGGVGPVEPVGPPGRGFDGFESGGVGPVEPVGPPGVHSSAECFVSPVRQLGNNRSIAVTRDGEKTEFLFLARTDGGFMLDFKGPLSRCY